MRLIDADELKNVLVKHFDAYFNENGKLMYSDHICTSDDVSDLFNLIDKQPTAYDIDKVVEKLEEMIHPKQLYFCKYSRGGCKHLDNDDKDCMECVVENAIEIVKQGGARKDVDK